MLMGLGTLVALLVGTENSHRICAEVFLATAIYAGLGLLLGRLRSDHTAKLRLSLGYFYVLWYFLSVARFVEALELATFDTTLLAIDQKLLGDTPAVTLDRWVSPAATEVMSGLYLSYLVYLHVAIVHALVMPVETSRKFATWLFSAYAISMPCYLLVPAVGPKLAFADLFASDLVGGFLSRWNRRIVEPAGAKYDVFPSLHVLITLTLLTFDYRFCRIRFYVMSVVAIGIFASTLYLRYHYLVDLVAGIGFYFVALVLFWERKELDVATDT